MENKSTKVNKTTEAKAGVNTVLADSKKFVRCLYCEWIACENHEKCLKYMIK